MQVNVSLKSTQLESCFSLQHLSSILTDLFEGLGRVTVFCAWTQPLSSAVCISVGWRSPEEALLLQFSISDIFQGQCLFQQSYVTITETILCLSALQCLPHNIHLFVILLFKVFLSLTLLLAWSEWAYSQIPPVHRFGRSILYLNTSSTRHSVCLNSFLLVVERQ